jgi:predicted RNA-binding protein YlqC (UPF0109 family)
MDSEDLIEIYAPRTLKWLYETISALCDEDLDVFVDCDCTATGATFKVKVAPSDVGKVIGKSGRNADALRTLLYARARKEGTRYTLDICDSKRVSRPGGEPIYYSEGFLSTLKGEVGMKP